MGEKICMIAIVNYLDSNKEHLELTCLLSNPSKPCGEKVLERGKHVIFKKLQDSFPAVTKLFIEPINDKLHAYYNRIGFTDCLSKNEREYRFMKIK